MLVLKGGDEVRVSRVIATFTEDRPLRTPTDTAQPQIRGTLAWIEFFAEHRDQSSTLMPPAMNIPSKPVLFTLLSD